MRTIYPVFAFTFSFLCISAKAQFPTTVVNSTDCNFTYTFNTSNEGFSSPSIYSDANDLGLYWDGSRLVETAGANLNSRSASTISPIYVNTEHNATTVGFDYEVPANTDYRVRVVSTITNAPLEILATTANGPIWTPLPGTSGSICIELQDEDLPAGGHIRIEITFRATNPGILVLDNFRRLALESPLPVTFLGLIARENNDGTIRLLWNVAEEINVTGYDVETSNDGINFTRLANVPAGGKSNYFYNTNEIIKGTRYFRIKNVDVDGRFKYSGVIRIKNNTMDGLIKLYPVPVSDVLFIEHRKVVEPATVTISDMQGKIVFQTVTQPNSYQTSIHVRQLIPGMYIVRYQEKSGISHTAKFIRK